MTHIRFGGKQRKGIDGTSGAARVWQETTNHAFQTRATDRGALGTLPFASRSPTTEAYNRLLHDTEATPTFTEQQPVESGPGA